MRKLIYLGFFCLNFSCAVKVKMPAQRFITPETNGHFMKGGIGIGGGGAASVQVVDDRFSSTPSTVPSITKDSETSANVHLGLASFMDLYYHAGSESPVYVGAKIQLLGDPSETSKQGNFSLAIAGAAAFGSDDDSSTIEAGTSSEVISNVDVKYGGWEAMVLLGYRPSDKVIVYTGPFQTETTAEVTVTRSTAGTTTTTASPKGKGTHNGIVAGVRFGKNFYFGIEGSKSEATWTRTEPLPESEAAPKDIWHWGLSTGFGW